MRERERERERRERERGRSGQCKEDIYVFLWHTYANQMQIDKQIGSRIVE